MKFCSLYSGSSGNSIFIASDNTRVLIDAGLAGKKIDEALKHIGEEASSIDGIFITHEHIDHIKGVGVLSSMIFLYMLMIIHGLLWKKT